jgi:hypothetical protein
MKGTNGPNPGGPNPAAFKGGRSELANRVPTSQQTEHRVMGFEIGAGGAVGGHGSDRGEIRAGIAERSTKPVDVMDVGQNRAHVGIGREYAIRETAKDGSVHPTEHAGRMGKGRW